MAWQAVISRQGASGNDYAIAVVDADDPNVFPFSGDSRIIPGDLPWLSLPW